MIDPRYLALGAVKNHMIKANATGKITRSKWPSFRRKSAFFQAKANRATSTGRPDLVALRIDP